MKILLVDDSRTMRNIQKKSLEVLGPLEVSEAGDGVEALSVIAASGGGFNLIMVDWNMPNMTGIELLRAIRADDQLKHLPVLMVTAEAKKENIVAAAQAAGREWRQRLSPPTVAERAESWYREALSA